MDYQEFRTQSGNKLYILDHSEDSEEALQMIARTRKIGVNDLVAVPVWIKEYHGYTMSVVKEKGFKERIAIMKESLWRRIKA